MGKLQVVVDGQYGSTGKGAVAAHLARQREAQGMAAVRVAGPNAGHTAVDRRGVRWALRQIPVAAVVNNSATLYIAAGSEIDISVLLDEAARLEAAGHAVYDRLIIDPMATILEPRHQQAEAELVGAIGSTGKGIGAARADRIMRGARLVRDTDLADRFEIAPAAPELLDALDDGQLVQIEGTQGHALGLHHPNYPQVTSSDCRAIDFLAMAGVMPWDERVDQFEVWLVFRPYPIRVAGNSGPLKGETTWEALGLPEEKTTVTQKVRRVGLWDPDLAREAVAANGGPGPHLRVALTMADQLSPEVAGTTSVADLTPPVLEFIDGMEELLRTQVRLVGTSDRTMVAL